MKCVSKYNKTVYYMKLNQNKATVFVKHIEKHLKEYRIKGKVECWICGKDIDQIYKEEGGM